MKKFIIALLLAVALILTACSGKTAPVDGQPNASATPGASETLNGGFLPGGTQPGGSSQPETPAPTAAATSALYDPSIYVIHAAKTWQMELAKGYYANYECEIYLEKVDSNDNRVSTGAYQGNFWMNCTLDAQGFIKDMIGSAPIQLDFAGGGEVVSDNFGIYLNTTDDKAWVDYSIPDAQGNPLPLTRDTPVAKGSFTVVSKNVYLEARGSGAQGEKIDYSDFSESEQYDYNYVVHMDPDTSESGGVRKVIFYITDSNGVCSTVEGTMTRLPGYPEDVTKYHSSKEYQDAVSKHFQD